MQAILYFFLSASALVKNSFNERILYPPFSSFAQLLEFHQRPIVLFSEHMLLNNFLHAIILAANYHKSLTSCDHLWTWHFPPCIRFSIANIN